MADKKRIGDIRRGFLLDFGIDVPVEKIRDYEEAGCFSSSRDENTDFREYTDTQADEARKSLMLIEIGVPVKDVVASNEVAIQTRISSIGKVLTDFNRQRGTNGYNNSAVDRRKA